MDSSESLFKRLVTLERRACEQTEEIQRLLLENGIDFSKDGNRELISGPRAKELFADCAGKANKRNIKYVRLSGKSFGKDAALVAADELQKLNDVTCVDLSDVIAGRDEAEALEVLSTMITSLTGLSIHSLDLSENALGEKGIRALQPALSALSQLKEIKFKNNGLSELSVRLLVEVLPTDNLRLLHFHNNMSGSGGALAAASLIRKSPVLEDFMMSSSRVQSDGGLPLLQSLKCCAKNLTRIDISDSMFGDEECVETLVNLFPKMNNLTSLTLRDTGLKVETLLEGLSKPGILPKIAALDLSGLELSSEHGALVGSIIKKSKRLQKLWLDDNELESAGVLEICRAAGSQPMLELLSVKANQIGSQGALALAKFALRCPFLKRLEIDENTISAEGIVRMNNMLASGQRLSVVGELDDNDEDGDEDDTIDDEVSESDHEVDDLAEKIASGL